MAIKDLQTRVARLLLWLEEWLDSERDQLALWLPVMLALGIGLWFGLPSVGEWIAAMLAGAGVALAGVMTGIGRRFGRALLWCGLAISLGCALAWLKAEQAPGDPLSKIQIAQFEAKIVSSEASPSRDGTRLLVEPVAGQGLPGRVRVTVDEDKMPGPIFAGERAKIRARLVPPPEASIPGAYNFARIAWFNGIGATGKALDAPVRLEARAAEPSLRERLSAHILSRLPGSAGGIAAAFASGSRAGISQEDEEAMRASGLTHLLSISGLHITAVVGAAMFLCLRLLALSPWLALRWPLLVISAGAGALAGIGYTVLTGAEVPTVRSCIAAVLVLFGLALGREAVTLRLVATGALIVLLIWPQSLVGPSFQLSFAAITSLVALHEHPKVKAWTMRRDEGLISRLLRSIGSLLLTGVVVEIALAPIALYHFHKSGLFGALANIVAIPLTTFVIMPAEALALLFDTIGLGTPFWWLTGQGLNLLLWIAQSVAVQPGALARLPSIPFPAFALMLAGGLWLVLWKRKPRFWGGIPFMVGAIWAVLTPLPDLLITGDGKHLAVRGDDGAVTILRTRAGDYVRDLMADRSGDAEGLADLDDAPNADCSPDVCTISLNRGGRNWRVAATRSIHRLPWEEFTKLCAQVDLIISDRRLPQGCAPKWLKIDSSLLARTGGMAITLASGKVETVRTPGEDHPWVRPQSRLAPPPWQRRKTQ
jgi:competence protein ComEC